MKRFFFKTILVILFVPALSLAMDWQDGLVHAVRHLTAQDVYDSLLGLVNPNNPDSQGRYALHEALKLNTKDSIEKVRLLLIKNANPEIKQDGRDALQIALDEGTSVNNGLAKIRLLLSRWYLKKYDKMSTPSRTVVCSGPVYPYPDTYRPVFQEIVDQELVRKKNYRLYRNMICALRDAVHVGDEVACSTLLAQGASPNRAGFNVGESAFYDALIKKDSNSIALVALMVRKGCSLERIYGRGNCVYNAFRQLLQSGTMTFQDKVAKFKILMDAGVDIDFSLVRRLKAIYDKDKLLPEFCTLEKLFNAAVEHGRHARTILPGVLKEFFPEQDPAGTQILSLLVGEYAFPYYCNEYNYDSPELDKNNTEKLAHYLMEATQEYDLQKAEHLLDLGADPYYSRRGMHRLYEAVRDSRKQSVGVVQLLVRKGFDVNRQCRGEHVFNQWIEDSQDKKIRRAKLTALMEGGIRLDFEKVRRLKYMHGSTIDLDVARKEYELGLPDMGSEAREYWINCSEQEKKDLLSRRIKHTKSIMREWGTIEQLMFEKVKAGSRARDLLPAALEPLLPTQQASSGRIALSSQDLFQLVGCYAYPYYNYDVQEYEDGGRILYKLNELKNKIGGWEDEEVWV